MGERSVLVGTRGPRIGHGIVQRARAHPEIEVVVGLRSVLISSNEPLESALVAALGAEVDEGATLAQPRHHEIPVVFDGEDLDEAAALLGTSTDAVAAMVLEADLEVAFLGFSPGFGYLTGLTGPLRALSRRATPRPRVPAGSLAVAASMVALYPDATPGGWWLLGRTEVVLFDQLAKRPALLGPGDTVSFVMAQSGAVSRIPAQAPRREGLGALEVEETPAWITVVDHPRQGVAALGVPSSGPFDPERAHLARALVGSSDGCLEVAGVGLQLRAHEPCTVAAIDLVVTVDGRTAPPGQPVGLGVGQQLRVVGVGRGGRGYLAMAGGPGGPMVLGSRGTDALCHVGPGPVRVGDRLAATVMTTALPGRAEVPRDDEVPVLRVTQGPHSRALMGGIEQLDGWAGSISPVSSKVGLRIEGDDDPLAHHGVEITSVPVITGTVQLAPDGTAIVLGPDHATVGGYPVIAVVIDADLPMLGRLGPGDHVRMAVVTVTEAVVAAQQRAAIMAAALSGVTPGTEGQGRLASWG